MYAIKHLQADRGTWYWAVHFRRRGRLYYKRFYEPKYGGSQKALRGAISWRDRELVKAKALTFREFHQQKRSNNRSGVPGVHFLKTERQPRGIWQAKTKLPTGKKITKTFSVRKFGSRKAFELAVKARREMLMLVGDRLYLYHPTARRFAAQGGYS
jgi:hypothetical protein